MDKKPHIVIIEDHPVMRKGLVSWFAATERWNVAGTASSLAEAKDLFSAQTLEVDIVLLDIQLSDGWGFDIIPWLNTEEKYADNPPYFAVYSSFIDYTHVKAALNYGVHAYISKQRSESEVESILIDVLNEKTSIDEIVSSKFQQTEDSIKLLTKREEEIFLLIKERLSNKEIANRLNIKRKTVENHLFMIHDKTGLSRSDLENL
jgi:DNA-binding NarL/FixJ family response regulator